MLICVIGLLTYILLCLAAYRITDNSKPEIFEGKVLYKFIEFNGTNRQLFEEIIMQNRTIRLEDNSIWYVSKPDHLELWPENPHEMNKKGYTIKARLKAQKLYLGGYSKAEVIATEKLNENPIIRK